MITLPTPAQNVKVNPFIKTFHNSDLDTLESDVNDWIETTIIESTDSNYQVLSGQAYCCGSEHIYVLTYAIIIITVGTPPALP